MHRARRANFTTTKKVATVREALLERRPVSEVCERYRIQPSQFCQWQKQLVESGVAVHCIGDGAPGEILELQATRRR